MGSTVEAGGRPDQERLIRRLRRIEGQVRGLQRMVEEEKGCEEILTQLAAVRAALDRVGVFVISRRMQECLESTGEPVSPEALEAAFDVFFKYSSLVR